MSVKNYLKVLAQNESQEEDCCCPLSEGFEDAYSRKPRFMSFRRPWNPPTDIYETRDHIVIKMELAGVKKNQVDITLDQNVLSIQGVRHEEAPDPKKSYHLMEIHYGVFQRAFHLSTNVRRTEITATMKEGFLKITIPKKKLIRTDVDIET